LNFGSLLRPQIKPAEVKDIAAIVLAAGRSRRMGAFKPLLPFGDSTVIESCINNIRAAGVEKITIVTGHRTDEVRAQLEHCPVNFTLNPEPDSEMSVSIALGVSQIGEDAKAVLITPADHPGVAPEIIKSVIDEWRQSEFRLIQPEYESRGGHPVLIDLSYRNELLHLDPQTGLRSLFTEHREQVRRLPVSSPLVARDMDTWEDYLDLHLAVFGRKPEQTSKAELLAATNGKPPGLI
jgi:molybdenum cofactor cytidylyltransferase